MISPAKQSSRTPGTARSTRQRLSGALCSVYQGGVPDRVIPLGERHLRRTITTLWRTITASGNHQGIANELIQPLGPLDAHAPVRRRERMGGLLNLTTVLRSRKGWLDDRVCGHYGADDLRPDC